MITTGGVILISNAPLVKFGKTVSSSIAKGIISVLNHSVFLKFLVSRNSTKRD